MEVSGRISRTIGRYGRPGTGGPLAWPPVRFVIVGSTCFASVLLLFDVLRGVLALPFAATIAYAAGAAASYELNRSWTFGLRSRDWPQAGRFAVITAVAMVLNAGLLRSFVAMSTLPGLAAEVLALLSIAPLTFLAYRYWAFRMDRQGVTLSPGVVTSGAGTAGNP